MGDATRQEEKHLLIIDDEANMRHMLGLLLGRAGYCIDGAADGEEALKLVQEKSYRFILCDL